MSQEYVAFMMFVAAATASPGGASTLATVSGMRFGIRRSLPYIAGIAVGLSSIAIASALGLTALLMAVPTLEFALRVAGTAYLLYLAWRIVTGGPPSGAAHTSNPVGFLGATALTWYNPKAWAITLSASSSFAHLAEDPTSQAVVMGATFLAFAAASMALWCATGHALGRLLETDRSWLVLNTIMGLLLATSIVPMWLDG